MGVSALRIDSRYADLDFLKENLWGDRLLSDTKKFLELPEIKSASQPQEEISNTSIGTGEVGEVGGAWEKITNYQLPITHHQLPLW